MLLKKLAFKNFKSFSSDLKNQKLDKLDILTLLYGENNSGKSNLLKFIKILFKPKFELDNSFVIAGQSISKPSDKSPFWKGRISNDAFLFHKNDRTKNISFEVTMAFKPKEISQLENSKTIIKEFNLTGKSFDLEIKGIIKSLSDPYDSEIILETVFLNKKEIYSVTAGKENYFQGVSGLKGDSITFENLLGLLNDCVLFLDHNRFLNTESESGSERELTPNNFKNWLHNLTLDPLKYSKYVEFLQFVKANSISGNTGKVLAQFDPTYSRKDNEIDIFLKTNSERFPINSFGTGIMQILLILSLIYESNARIVLIEELELNLSPATQQELLKILSGLITQKVIDQVIVTSHSGVLANTKALSVYEVQLSEQGVSKALYKTKAAATFFARKSANDTQMASVVRTSGIKGPEWE
jgi:predicted ATP-dependent endonuclease of OLD family